MEEEGRVSTHSESVRGFVLGVSIGPWVRPQTVPGEGGESEKTEVSVLHVHP